MPKDTKIECPECGCFIEMEIVNQGLGAVVAYKVGDEVVMDYAPISEEAPLETAFVCGNVECSVEVTEEELMELARKQMEEERG